MSTDAPAADSPRRPPGAVVRFLLPWLAIFALMAAWALASPLAGPPDEPAHLVQAGSVARGQFTPLEQTVEGSRVVVPDFLAVQHLLACHATDEEVPASCVSEHPQYTGADTEALTTAGLYNPLYYVVVGWPSLLVHDESAVYLMRLASALVVSLFLALVVAEVALWRNAGLAMAGVAVAATPMVLYLGGSVNPNALEITAVAAVFTAMLGLVLEPDGRRMRGRLVVVAVASVVAANTRGISPLWVALALVFPLLLLPSLRALADLLRRPAVIATVLVVVAGVAASALWTLSSNSLGAGTSDGGTGAGSVPSAPPTDSPYPGVGISPAAGFVFMVVSFPSYLGQAIGLFGWTQTEPAGAVYWLWRALLAAIMVAVVLVVRRRRLVIAVLLGLCVIVVPAAVQAAYVTQGGVIWQGRYSLPVFMMFAIGAAALVRPRPGGRLDRGSRVLLVIVAAVWAIANAHTFVLVLHRYALGLSASWAELFSDPLWQPPGGTVLIAAWGVLAAAAVAVTLVLAAGRGREGAPAPAPHPLPR